MLIGMTVPETAGRIRAVGRPGWVNGRDVGANKHLVLEHYWKFTAGTRQLGMLSVTSSVGEHDEGAYLR